MHEQVGTIYEQQKAIGYPSTFIEGADDSMNYMKGLFDDWQAQGHHLGPAREEGRLRQQQGAACTASPPRPRARACASSPGVEVLGFEFGSNSNAVTALVTNRGTIACEQVIVGVGPWVNRIWNMLELPKTIAVKGRDGKLHNDVPMWKYWCLEEGTLGVDPNMHKTERRALSAGHPCRHRRAALFRRRRLAHHRQALGPLLQARLQFRRHPGRRLALQGRAGSRRGRRRSLRTGIAGLHRRREFRRDVVLGAGALPEALRGQDRRSTRTRGKIRRARLLHARQFPGLRHVSARTST